MPDWQEFERQMQPARDLAATVKSTIDQNLENLEDIKAAVTIAKEVLRNAEHRMLDYEELIAAALASALGIEGIELGWHVCKHSPTKQCFYDAVLDHCCDSCLMCGQPDERK